MAKKIYTIENWNLPNKTQKFLLSELAKINKDSISVLSLRFWEYEYIKQLEKIGLININVIPDNTITIYKKGSLTIQFDGPGEIISVSLSEFGKFFINIIRRKLWVSFFLKSVFKGVFYDYTSEWEENDDTNKIDNSSY